MELGDPSLFCAWAPTNPIHKRSRKPLLIERIQGDAAGRACQGKAATDGDSSLLTRGECCSIPAGTWQWRGRQVELTVHEFLILKRSPPRPGHVKNSRSRWMRPMASIHVDDRTHRQPHSSGLRKKFR